MNEISLDFSLSESNCIKVKTSLLYPDNDVLDFFIVKKQDDLILTDFGETIRWLLSQNISDTTIEKILMSKIKNMKVNRYKGILFVNTDYLHLFKDIKSFLQVINSIL